MIAVKAEVLRTLLSDPEWNAKLNNAKTMREVESVLREFAVVKKLKVEEVRINE